MESFTFTATRAFLAAASLLAPLMAFAAEPLLSPPEHFARNELIEKRHQTDEVHCSAMSGSAQNICSHQATGRLMAARAQIEYDLSGKPADLARVRQAQADAEYAVEKTRCGDAHGSARSLCLAGAKASRAKAASSATLERRVGEARADAIDTDNKADWTVAKERCSTLSEPAHDQCVGAAKKRYGN